MAPIARATHLRAIEIEVVSTCHSPTVEIIVTAYINFRGTSVTFGGDGILQFGDGTSVMVPETGYEVIDADLYVGRAQYKISHSYANYGVYKIGYSETNRTAGIVNFAESVNTPFYTESTIVLEEGVCNSSPRLLAPPIDMACTGIAFFHNAGAIDVDGDSLSYELTIPKRAPTTEVKGYRFPNLSTFYSSSGIDYEHANEQQDGRPSFSIDAISGTLTWDAPGRAGEYSVAIKVKEWKLNASTGAWYEAGGVTRDMQIIVEDCSNKRPRLDIPLTACVTAGSTLVLTIPATDPEYHNVVTQAFSEIFTDAAGRARVEPPAAITQSTKQPHDTAALKIIWETSCQDVQVKAYRVVLKISDRPPEGTALATFYTLDIKIVAPAPDYDRVAVNPVTKEVNIEWNEYACDNVVGFQIWRRVAQSTYEYDECHTGIPESLRYHLRAEVPAATASFTDTDLSIGAQYCYRLVSLVGEQRVPGRMSIDTCFIPKPAEAPVIVNVSVQQTDTAAGQILVRWTRPFDIDVQQYPVPHTYKVFRMNASSPDGRFEPVMEDVTSDTLFTDTGLNTVENIYSYRIELYVPTLTSTPVDTSSGASSVYAETTSSIDEIKITWQANTPWYNYTERYPYHLIYRSNNPNGPFELIDSVDVNESDFRYSDKGEYRSLGLTDGNYYYKVLTRGVYGNRNIVEPLENFSQAVPGQLLDTIPPCVPSLTIREADCTKFACDGSDYSTTLNWDSACEDVVAYEVFVKDTETETYKKIATVDTNVFVHQNISSLNKCYRIVSLDDAGNRSDSSIVVCNSNCTNFELPNVITPGIKDNRNDYLTTFSGEDCARSVQSVRLKIFSRWADEIFTTVLDGDSKIFWDGKNANGEDVASGVYFYQADVIFDTNKLKERNQRIHGWVHVLH